ncbi:hypothetical protein [Arachidicoccus terrestris]|uniref:hypothetical protein n=1 Tax=Arachidicoccus terrestris TaxID=2875539 RepID=UPI001CC58F57|nr:hypothetical protein [Arachidicoccus terrestris]UAY54800.1 hypothetical protein K9M52_15330 [Arachidicoccus terrestris]
MAAKKTALAAFNDAFKASLETAPYPSTSVGFNKLKRSIIEKEEGERISFYLDRSSALEASIQAMKLGITTDELFRRLIWLFVSSK